MSISKKDVKYIANLSRLHIPEEQLEGFTKNLEDILKYVEQLQTLDVEHVKPTSHAIPMANVMREDVVLASLTNAPAMAIAVESKDGAFKVPLVIE